MSHMAEKQSTNDFLSSISRISSDFERVNQLLEEEKKKNDLILSYIGECIFFIDNEFRVMEGYSKKLDNIFNRENLSEGDFFGLLENKVPENIIENTREYLEFMFNKEMEEETINEINPLQQVELHYEDQMGLWTSSRFISFNFNRIIADGEIKRLFGTARDVSDQLKLSKKLEEMEENNKKQMEWLVNILHVEPPLLKEFVNVIEYELSLIDSALKNPKNTRGPDVIVRAILRAAHHIRNNASLLNLKFFTNKVQEFESEISAIKQKSEISGSDFVPVVVQLGEMRQMLNEIKVLMQRLKHFRNSLRTTRRYEDGLLIRAVEHLINKLCKEFGKEVNFIYSDFDSLSIPYSYHQLVKEFLLVLTRFSIMYGIEKPEERKTANLNPIAIIEIETFSDKRQSGFKFRHNGRLIRIERMLQKAVEMPGPYNSDDGKGEEGSELGSEVIRLLFMPGASTTNLTEAEHSKEIFRDMDLVKKKLKMHGGSVKITFTSEEFCEYTIALPKKK